MTGIDELYQHAAAYLAALGPGPYDFRAISDKRKDVPAKLFRGELAELWPTLQAWNATEYGIHVMMNETDGVGRSIANVRSIRCQMCDLDGPNTPQNYKRAVEWQSAPPHMIVNTSPGKAQVYWLVNPHHDTQLYVDNQRRLIAHFEGDPQVIDVAHTARVPGFMHHKQSPHLVTLQAGPAWGKPRIDPWVIGGALYHVPIVQWAAGRQPLGTASLAAPSIDWLHYALSRIDPNALDRSEWIAITAAAKQAGWLFGEAAVWQVWATWCAQYRHNDLGENAKQWHDIKETQAGWNALVKRSGLQAELMFGQAQAASAVAASSGVVTVQAASAAAAQAAHAVVDTSGFMLTPAEQSVYFKGCYWVNQAGRIFTPYGRLMTSTEFNGTYGGKVFILSDTTNKVTDEAWKAATRGPVYHVPKIDHLRFLPDHAGGEVVKDEFGRLGLNTYIKPNITLVAGDVSLFIDHLTRLLPNDRDRAIVVSWLAHNVQYPGVKIPWSIVIQSMEGAGKTAFKSIMAYALGGSYIHSPKAQELIEGGGKFNGWMQNKLMIIVDEIKIDEKRDLIEVLKPMITDKRIEMEKKGVDQDMNDNPANWLMFTNYKDAIPVHKNGRRFCINYSAVQNYADLMAAGMDGAYFNRLYRWIDHEGGASAVGHYLMHYQMPDEFNPSRLATRAPETSSTAEALINSRSMIEAHIVDAVEGNAQGFRDGWISTVAVSNMLRENGMRVPGPNTIAAALASLGYHRIGKATKSYFQEASKIQSRLYNLNNYANLHNYGRSQGYEP